jgi:hypothetical protein
VFVRPRERHRHVLDRVGQQDGERDPRLDKVGVIAAVRVDDVRVGDEASADEPGGQLVNHGHESRSQCAP